MTVILNKLKHSIRTSAMDILTDMSCEIHMDKEEMANMFANMGALLFDMQNITCLSELIKDIENDHYAITGFESGEIDNLFRDACK